MLYSIYSYYKILAIFPVLYNISLELIYLIHNSLYFLIPYAYLAPVGFVTTCLGRAWDYSYLGAVPDTYMRVVWKQNVDL